MNDNEVKGEGNQQDYGMRIYDPRIAKFLSVDPITAKYPELTPYQFASNRPIDGIDLDGLEFTEYVYPQQIINRNMRGMNKKDAAEYYSRGNRIGALVVGGAMVAGAAVAYATGAGLYTLATGASWLSVPSNQLTVSTGAGFAFNMLNPDPGTQIDFPVEGDEVGRLAVQAFKKVPRFAKSLRGADAELGHLPGLTITNAEKGGEDVARYLKATGAKATYWVLGEKKGMLVLGNNPTRQEVLEEVIHYEQHMKFGSDYFQANRNALEVVAQDILLNIGQAEKWSKSAMNEIKQARKHWVKLLENEKKSK